MAAYTTIDDPEAYFQTVIYTGNGSTQSITLPGTTDMQPDMVWFKRRDDTDSHKVVDAVRGVTKRIIPDTTAAEVTDDDVLTSFNSDGFSLGDDSSSNASSASHVAWCWKAGTTSGIAGSPSITPSSYSFNQTAGFSIIAYTGTATNATLPHGLGVAPHFMVTKRLNASQLWTIYTQTLGGTKILALDTADAAVTASNKWNDTNPTSTLLSIGDGDDTNSSSAPFILYCFTSIQGFSKFGSYVGNGNADGTFVYLGFRPAYVMLKWTTGGQNWFMFDSKRSPFNVNTKNLYADESGVEGTADRNDFLSNGFKIRESGAGENGSGNIYTYLAFAEAPFVNSNGVPCNAR